MEKTKKLNGSYEVLITTPDGKESRLTFLKATSSAMAISTSATAAEIGYAITLHFLAPHNGDTVLALPPELHPTPYPQLAEEVNRLLGYPALSL